MYTARDANFFQDHRVQKLFQSNLPVKEIAISFSKGAPAE
jgi:hypothetical protein